MTLLRRWFEEDPDSITARVSMAMALTYYAWFARGSGSAALVSPEGWNLVEERVSDASRILKAAHDLPEKCPGWYTAWMVKAMLGGDLASYPAVFGEAIHDFPGYTPFYFMGAWRLQERWYGRPGQWQAFATNAADEAGGEAGDILYARIVWYVRSFHFFSNPIADPGLDWPRVKRGFEAIRRQYPDSLLALSEYCSICRFAPSGGPELMRKLFGEIGDRVDLGVWPTMDNFLQNRQWAFSH